MTSQQDKPKRWRPKFSVRTLVILVTLVCCYAACWGPTKRQGASDIGSRLSGASGYNPWLTQITVSAHNIEPVVPLLVQTDEANSRRYYFWCFGYVAKLPWERADTKS